MVVTRKSSYVDSEGKPASFTGPEEDGAKGYTEESTSHTQQKTSTSTEPHQNANIQSIVEAIVQAFSDKRLVEERLAPALGPVLAPALHNCFMMELKERDTKIQQLESKLSKAEARLEDLEQYSRRNCLIIHGTKETSNENTDQLICTLAKDHLKVDLAPEDIDRSHRIGVHGKTDKNGRQLHRPIIVKFTKYGPRSRFYDARSKLKATNIYIHENLTSDRQRLMRKVKERYPAPNKIWTQDGKIRVKTPSNVKIVISSESDWQKHKRST